MNKEALANRARWAIKANNERIENIKNEFEEIIADRFQSQRAKEYQINNLIQEWNMLLDSNLRLKGDL